ncbi:MAG: beta-ketoacyl-ACP synthase II [Deltaproteobacteria bacterium]|nr:beta-ketoacyl-ACP synthase II [Deltaproteobacteria bacterium]MBW2019088.1 beta-ketoacyl-ACP synthase II [Deltaproteobacteria bacterium]MBW2073521.1 beta-ketoacyl-ACP synthase II [Deltaproteobacteria bacterium]
MERKRVVITGVGAVTPIGCGKDKFWNALMEGKSGVDLVTRFDTSDFKTRIGAEIKNFDPQDYGIKPKDAKRMDLFTQYGVAAASLAIEDAGLKLAEYNDRVGTIIGTGIGGLMTLEEEKKKLVESQNPSKVSPFLIPMMMPNAVNAYVSIIHKLTGTSPCPANACATGSYALIYACKDIALGDLDVLVTGGSEAILTEISASSFANMKALSRQNEDPKGACRPFDKGRNGFVIGEGAGVLVLESLEHALARGARIYAEIVGYATNTDAYHITAPDPGARMVKKAILDSLNMAGIEPKEVDYINAHGTSTQLNDKAEATAIRAVFGDYKVPVSSTKSMIGHLIGAAGAVEAIACALAIENQIIPPNINYETPDPEIDLNIITKPTPADLNVVMNNSFGFGGHNAVMVLKRYTG